MKFQENWKMKLLSALVLVSILLIAGCEEEVLVMEESEIQAINSIVICPMNSIQPGIGSTASTAAFAILEEAKLKIKIVEVSSAWRLGGIAKSELSDAKAAAMADKMKASAALIGYAEYKLPTPAEDKGTASVTVRIVSSGGMVVFSAKTSEKDKNVHKAFFKAVKTAMRKFIEEIEKNEEKKKSSWKI